jgi:hypothetical protein
MQYAWEVHSHISWLELLSFDKFVHASIFFGLQVLTMRAFIFSTGFEKSKWLILLFCVAYGGGIRNYAVHVFFRNEVVM